MNPKFLFAFVLLVTLSVAHAIRLEKRGTKFTGCADEKVSKQVSTLEITLSPDPFKPKQNVKFTVSGKTKIDIKDEDGFVFINFFNKKNEERGFNFIPIPQTKAGDSFKVSEEVQVPASKEDMATLTVKVFNYHSDVDKTLLACAKAKY
ncbi:11684_t:CDS:1 [Racocetra fulgida]|uniref:11684_t:CDS:1 n=1 Tax=Racocetra fulgida TaxID=60492 RepID=A0A9N9AVL6_9GLOM|nr:11684_t:CDS:1 [Racocetra fulgida]